MKETNDTQGRSAAPYSGLKSVRTSRWVMPIFTVLMGVVILVASWMGGNPRDGLFGLALMTCLAGAVMLGGRRSESLRLMTQPDERWAGIDRAASLLAGYVLLTLVIGSWIYELSQGQDGDPYARLMAITGVSYLIALVFLRWRR